MYKELIISAIIIVGIFMLDYITQNYTNKAINEAIQDLSQICEHIKNIDKESDEIIKEANEKYEKWQKRHKRLAFYIEHTELEKAESSYIGGKSYIELIKYEDAIAELERTILILKHIDEKYSIDWENIF